MPMPRRYRRLLSFLLISVLRQFGVLYGMDRLLKQSSGINLEPAKTTEVKARTITLSPAPESPDMAAVSADHTRLAVMNTHQLSIYNLTDGREVLSIALEGSSPGTLQWLPDRNRLIFTIVSRKSNTKTVTEPAPRSTGVRDETYTTETFRHSRTVIKEGFEIGLYSLDGQAGAEPELIQNLWQGGTLPKKMDLSLSTYTNLLYVHWVQGKQDNLAQIDIMKRVKDFNLPNGDLTRLVVTPRSGELWAEMSEDNTPSIYKFIKKRWRLQKFLDGYILLGVTPDEQLAVAPDPDQDGLIKEVELVDDQGNFKPGWAFSSPIRAKNVRILNDGRLIYFDNRRVIIHTPQLGKGTVFNIPRVDAYSPDGKMMLTWQDSSGLVKITEEVDEQQKSQ